MSGEVDVAAVRAIAKQIADDWRGALDLLADAERHEMAAEVVRLRAFVEGLRDLGSEGYEAVRIYGDKCEACGGRTSASSMNLEAMCREALEADR